MPAARGAVVDALRPFWGEGAAEPDGVLEGLVTRGWALRDADSRYLLSPEGDATRAALLERVKELRMAIADGVTPEAYQTTIDTLERMAANLAGRSTAWRSSDGAGTRPRSDRSGRTATSPA